MRVGMLIGIMLYASLIHSYAFECVSVCMYVCVCVCVCVCGEKSHHIGLTCAYVDDAKLISLQFLIFANFINLVCIQFINLHSRLIRYTKLFGFAILLHVKAVLKIYSSKKRNVASLVSVLAASQTYPHVHVLV